MKSGYSKLIISEFILPETKAGLFPSSLDIQMLSLSGGMERTEKQWQSLLNSVGLEIEQIWTFEDGSESVIQAVVQGTMVLT